MSQERNRVVSVSPEVPGRGRKLESFVTGEAPERPHVRHIGALIDPLWQGYVRPPGERRLGICCSGGGLRSATYNLGALQGLRRAGLLDAHDEGGARYLAAVSGGSYIAVAHTVMAGATQDKATFDDLPPWAPGSPEERHLRNHSDYLAPGVTGRVWFVTSALWGLACNILPFLLAVVLAASALGWLYGTGLQPDLVASPPRVAAGWLQALVALGPVAAGFGAIVLRRLVDRSNLAVTRLMPWLKAWSPRLVLLGAASIGVVFVLPLAVAFLTDVRVQEAVVEAEAAAPAGEDVGVLLGVARWVLEVLGGQVAGVSSTTLLAVLGQLSAAVVAVVAVVRANRGRARFLLPVAAWLAGPALLTIPLVVLTGRAMTVTDSGRLWIEAAVALGVFGVLSVVGHNVRWSLHPVYREQLSSAFVLRRRRLDDDSGVIAEPVPYAEPVQFSSLHVDERGPGHVPELIVCAAVNVSDDAVPPGRGAESFTFTREWTGGPATGYVPTARYEQGRRMSRLTLPAMMAISGAALSPSMGRMTVPSVRFLFALCNVRLGVWLRNPNRMGAVTTPDDEPAHPAAEDVDAPARPGVLRRAVAWLRDGWDEPGPLYVFFEAIGRNSLDRRHLAISDGGHWENLGLVELLRRGCTEVICVDASGDTTDTFHTIGTAMALARTELRVRIDIDFAPLRPDPDTGLSLKDHAVGRITYPDGTTGVLVFVKASLPEDAPWDVRAYRQRDPRFPCHSTGDQLFDDEQLESYRALGAHAGANAATTLQELRRRDARRKAREGRLDEPAALIER